MLDAVDVSDELTLILDLVAQCSEIVLEPAGRSVEISLAPILRQLTTDGLLWAQFEDTWPA